MGHLAQGQLKQPRHSMLTPNDNLNSLIPNSNGRGVANDIKKTNEGIKLKLD